MLDKSAEARVEAPEAVRSERAEWQRPSLRKIEAHEAQGTSVAGADNIIYS